MASPPRTPLTGGYLVSALRVLLVELLAVSEGPRAISEGSWIWFIARCWWPSWIQRALQLVQMAVGYRPKVMVTRADRHSGQRGMRTSRTGGGRSLSSVLRAVWRAGRPGRAPPDRRRPLSVQLGVVSSLLASTIFAGPGRTRMRLGLASSALGTMTSSTPLSNEASIWSAWTWAGRVIDRRNAP